MGIILLEEGMRKGRKRERGKGGKREGGKEGKKEGTHIKFTYHMY